MYGTVVSTIINVAYEIGCKGWPNRGKASMYRVSKVAIHKLIHTCSKTYSNNHSRGRTLLCKNKKSELQTKIIMKFKNWQGADSNTLGSLFKHILNLCRVLQKMKSQ